MGDACPDCKGCGALAPTPFHRDSEPPTAWVDHLVRVDALHAPLGPFPRESSPTLTGRLKPKVCPRCGGKRVGLWATAFLFGLDAPREESGVAA